MGLKSLSTRDLQDRVDRVKLLDQLPIWDTQQFCEYYDVSITWLRRRTGPKAKDKPFIPTLKTIGSVRIDRKVAQEVMSQYQVSDHRSVKTKEIGKSAAKQPERKFVQLW